MDAQLTITEINTFRDTLNDYDPALEALATLEEQDGKIEGSFEQLWVKKMARCRKCLKANPSGR